MKKGILIFISAILSVACLKNDILDKDLDGTNFQQSEFYQSGDFVAQFDVDVLDLEIDTTQNSQVGSVCRYTYQLKLKSNYVAQLNNNWEDNARIVFRTIGTPYTYIEYPLNTDYGKSFTLSTPAGGCNSATSDVDLHLELIDPHTGRVSATFDYKTISLPTSL